MKRHSKSAGLPNLFSLASPRAPFPISSPAQPFGFGTRHVVHNSYYTPMHATVFYSWQSDTKAAANRTLIQDALEAAVKELRTAGTIAVEPVLDRDTQGIPGAPDISTTIFDKIERCTVMVADVTIVGRGADRPAPNPNVLLELGFALKAIGWKRIILVQNLAFGMPENLPFHFRQKRILTFRSEEESSERASARRHLQASLKNALKLVLGDTEVHQNAAHPVRVSMKHENVNIRSGRHDYRLQVTLENLGTAPISEWHVDVSFPTRLLETGAFLLARIPARSDEKLTLFRGTSKNATPIFPGDDRLLLTIDYHMDDNLFSNLRGLLDEKVTAAAYVHGESPSKTECLVRDLQMF